MLKKQTLAIIGAAGVILAGSATAAALSARDSDQPEQTVVQVADLPSSSPEVTATPSPSASPTTVPPTTPSPTAPSQTVKPKSTTTTKGTNSVTTAEEPTTPQPTTPPPAGQNPGGTGTVDNGAPPSVMPDPNQVTGQPYPSFNP